MQPTPKALKRL